MNIIEYLSDKVTLVQFVKDLLSNSNINWRSITITKPELSEDSCVHIVTDMSSEDIGKNIQDYYDQHSNT